MTTITISPGTLSLFFFFEKKKDFSLPLVVQLECPPSSGQPFLLFCAYMAGHEPCSSFFSVHFVYKLKCRSRYSGEFVLFNWWWPIDIYPKRRGSTYLLAILFCSFFSPFPRSVCLFYCRLPVIASGPVLYHIITAISSRDWLWIWRKNESKSGQQHEGELYEYLNVYYHRESNFPSGILFRKSRYGIEGVRHGREWIKNIFFLSTSLNKYLRIYSFWFVRLWLYRHLFEMRLDLYLVSLFTLWPTATCRRVAGWSCRPAAILVRAISRFVFFSFLFRTARHAVEVGHWFIPAN